MLQNIEQQLPMVNSQQEKQLKAANAIRLQQAVASAPAGAGQADVQQLGAGAAAQNSKTELAQQAQQGQVQQQVGQQKLAVQGQQAQESLFNAQQATDARMNQQVNRLTSMNAQAKSELFDKEMQIKQDALGRQVLSTRQAADWAILNAKNQEELKGFAQNAQIAMDRKTQIIKQAYAILNQQMQAEADRGMQESNQAFTLEMKKAGDKLQEWIDDLEKKGTQFTQQMTMGGTIVGGIAGAVVGSYFPAIGTMAGAAGGAALGGYAGQAYAGSQGAANNSGVSSINTNVDSGGGYNRQY
jgi:hypothetical protein